MIRPKNRVKNIFSYFFIFAVSFLFLNFKLAVGFAEDFNYVVLKVVENIKDGGGYYVGNKLVEGLTQTPWQALDRFITISENSVNVDISKLRPSFCSSACYGILLRALFISKLGPKISIAAWKNLKPYTLGNFSQADGQGCWGMANANGPGLAVLIKRLEAGKNFYVKPKAECLDFEDYVKSWDQVKPGDFLKIFWNEHIGCDNKSKLYERGHLVVFLGKEVTKDGDVEISYFSSNGSGVEYQSDKGYGKQVVSAKRIYRAVATRITEPENFDNAKSIKPSYLDEWLHSLDGSHVADVNEMFSKI